MGLKRSFHYQRGGVKVSGSGSSPLPVAHRRVSAACLW
jgi:hypothetical protein